MTRAARVLLVVFTAFSLLMAALPAQASDDDERTAHRTVLGRIIWPDSLFTKPPHYEFSPLVSNSDPQTQHPAMWDGQDWDTTKWNKDWTPAVAIDKFFKAKIFVKNYMKSNKTPVVVVGPTFYKLSDLDRRRTLKLLTDTTGIFKNGARSVELDDWYTDDIVGAYTPKGLFLN